MPTNTMYTYSVVCKRTQTNRFRYDVVLSCRHCFRSGNSPWATDVEKIRANRSFPRDPISSRFWRTYPPRPRRFSRRNRQSKGSDDRTHEQNTRDTTRGWKTERQQKRTRNTHTTRGRNTHPNECRPQHGLLLPAAREHRARGRRTFRQSSGSQCSHWHGIVACDKRPNVYIFANAFEAASS